VSKGKQYILRDGMKREMIEKYYNSIPPRTFWIKQMMYIITFAIIT
jgi:hypothetical protein